MACFCYIVECSDGSYYTGWTTDPQRRERQHNRGSGARYTSTRRPVRMVYVETQPDRSAAMRRERKIKTLTHAQKKALIQKNHSLQGGST
jgi:putative endonuclease